MTQPTSTLPPRTGTTTVWPPPSWESPAPPAAPPAKRHIGRYIVGGIVLLFLVAGIAGSSEKKNDASSAGTVATTPTTTATPAATTGTTSAAPASVSMETWAGRYGADDASTLGDDMTALVAVASAGDVDGMATSCRTFQRDLTAAESHLPTPDAQLTRALTSAYGYYGQAATACINGIATLDPDELRKMMTYLPLGTESLKAATARIDLLS